MPVLVLDDGEIYYEECGTGHPLILAHGIGGNHAIWYQQIPKLSEHYRVISFDHRGFGNSTDGSGSGRSAFVADLEALVEHLGLRTVALVGQSMGGGTCLGYAAAHPDKVSALVLCDTLHGFVESDAVKSSMDVARSATADLSQLERVLGADTRENNPAQALLYSQLNSFNTADRHTLTGAFAPLVTPASISATGVPVMFLVGESDVLFPPSAVRLVHRELEGSEFVETAGVGHSVFFESPTEFNDVILSFLDKHIGANSDCRNQHNH